MGLIDVSRLNKGIYCFVNQKDNTHVFVQPEGTFLVGKTFEDEECFFVELERLGIEYENVFVKSQESAKLVAADYNYLEYTLLREG